MRAATLVVLAVLLLGTLACWDPRVKARLDAVPWWMVALGPSAALAVAGLFASGAPAGQTGWTANAAAVLAVAVAVTGGGPVTAALLRGAEPAVPEITHPTEPAEPAESRHASVGVADPIESRPTSHEPVRPVLRGGAWIGALERAAIAASLLAGLGEGVAVVLAIKGLGRYPELRASGAAERFIIGTFASLLWAGGAVGVALLLR
ncbi:hypothetical protein [Actinopolymorpha alba]|uniref:hypothetical protein n=1 Tax=Actinopolymorpha alba TaxID=533267 RepID=UPI00035CE384|nr:hypothetical protein [Actinopolymorpha alba]